MWSARVSRSRRCPLWRRGLKSDGDRFQNDLTARETDAVDGRRYGRLHALNALPENFVELRHGSFVHIAEVHLHRAAGAVGTKRVLLHHLSPPLYGDQQGENGVFARRGVKPNYRPLRLGLWRAAPPKHSMWHQKTRC